MHSEEKNKATKITPWVILAIVLCVIGVGVFSSNKPENNQEQKEQTESSKLYDAFKKCAVMEAKDIYATGEGKKTDNAFNDGRNICNDNFRTVYQKNEEQFVQDIASSWDKRKTETVEGKDLEYYLTKLDW